MSKQLRIVFMGTPHFAVEGLKTILNSQHDVVGVVTATDKAVGRGGKIVQSAVKEFAIENNLLVLQPEKLRNPGFISKLQSLNADLFVVIAFRMLPEVVWQMPKLGTFNLHASLLPKYRGAAPINWAIIKGEKKTGVSTFFIDDKIDTGNIIMQDETTISASENAGNIHDKLMIIGAKLVIKTIDTITKNDIISIPQQQFIKNGIEASPAPKLNKENTQIDWSKNAMEVHNFIRGLSPYPSAWTNLKNSEGKEVYSKILASEVIEKSNTNNSVQLKTDGKNYLHIVLKEGEIAIKKIQVAGKKAMDIKSFLRGTRDIEEWKIL